MSYKWTLTICAVVLAVLSLFMHIDPANVANSEFPSAQGGAHNIYRLVASLLFALASLRLSCKKRRGYKITAVSSCGCILRFSVMFITMGTMTVTQVGHLIIGTIVFAVLTALCPCKRVRHYKGDA